MTSRLAELYRAIVLDRAPVVLILLAAVFLLFGYWAQDFQLDASADSLILDNDEDLRRFRQTAQRYSTSDFLFVTYTPAGDLFSDRSIGTIVDLRDALKTVEGVRSVTSIVDIPLIKQKEGTLLQLSQNYRTLTDDDVDRDKARKELVESPLFSELIISKDGRTTALQVNLSEDREFQQLQRDRNRFLIKKHGAGLTEQEAQDLEQLNERYELAKTRVNRANHRVIQDIRGVIGRFGDSGELHLGGVSMIADDMITFIKNDLAVFGIGVFIFLVGMLSVIFRELRWVLLPLLSCVFSVAVMMGLLGMVGWRVTVISSNFISLMLILTMSMNVHLVVRYRQLRRDNPDWDQKALVFETTRKMVWPCLYTALTTMMGFGSLVISDIKPVIDFGWMMTMGLSVTFLTSFLLFPPLLVLMKPSKLRHTGSETVPFTASLAALTERHGGKVILVCLVLAVASVGGMTRLKVENSFVNYFSDETEIYQGLKLIDDKLGGTTPLNIIIKFPEAQQGDDEMDEFEAMFGEVDKADYWFTPEKVDLIKKVHDYLESQPEIGKVLSLASTIRLAESLMRGQEFNAFELAILYKRLPPEMKSRMISPYVSLDNDEARITVRVLDSRPDLRRKELLDRINRDLQQEVGLAPEQFQVSGLLVLYNNMLQSLFRSQILTLGVVMLGILVMLMVLFRSVSLATIGIVPNILAAAMILGLMGWLDIPLDMMTITIAAITIGIAVDNSIHYIYRFREEFPRQGQDYVRTMHYCHANIGRAVFYTAVTIIVGFSILVMSNFIPTIYFGLLTALAMAVALVMALTLLPRLIMGWKPF